MVNLFKKTISSVAAAAVVLTTSAATVQAGNSYGDVPSTAWFTPYVSALADAKVFDGSKSTFRPADTMNRAEFVKTLVSAAGISLDATNAGFSDVSDSAWFAPYVNAAVEAGIIDGPMAEKGNKFFPNDNISRAAATKIALGAFGINSADYQSPAAPFTDLNNHWGKEFVTAAYNLSIVDGKSATAFAPNDSIVRAAVAKVAAYTVIASADPATHVRFEDGTSAFSVYTAENISEKVSSIVTSTEEATDEEMTEEETTVEEEVTTPTLSDGSLEISLSSDSPKGAVVPYGVSGVEVAKYDITSNGDDVMLTSLIIKRTGLSSDDSVTNIALYTKEGRVTKAKSFNSSSDDATMTFLNGGLQIEAGETVTVSVMATIGASSNSGERVAMEIVSATAVTSNATEVVGDFPVTGSSFEIGSVAGASATISTDGTPSNPKLGTEAVEVSKFKVKNDSSDEAIQVSGITLKENSTIDEEEELENFELYADGKKVAEVAKMTSKYLTFNFDEAFSIASSKTIKFVVKADIIGGADKNIEFFLDDSLDIMAKGMKYGYGVSLTNSLQDANTTAISVEAGEITVVAVDPVATEIRKDKDDLVAGKIKVSSKAGTDLELQQLKLTLDFDYDATRNGADCDDALAAAVSDANFDYADVIENVEMYDEATGTTYDLATVVETNDADGEDSVTFADSDVTISLAGTKTFAFRFDTKNASAVACTKITASLASIGSDGGALYIEETQDDKAVTDITPSSVSFKQITGKAATATVTVLPLSSAKSAVIGSSDIVGLDFEVKADDASDLLIDELKVKGTVSDVASTSTITVTTADVLAGGEDPASANIVITKADATTDTIAVDVAAGATAAAIATSIASAIDADSDYSASASLAVVTVTGGVESIDASLLQASIIAAGAAGATVTTTYTNNGTTALATNSRITEVKLWKKEGTNETLIDTVSASQLASGVATFDGFNVAVAKSEKVRFIVTSSIVDDENNAYDTVQLRLTSLSVEDEDSDDVTATDGTTAVSDVADFDSARIATIRGAGTLSVSVDNTDSETDRAKNIIGGATSNFIASFELTAVNEAINIKDLYILQKTGGVDLQDYVESVSLYANDKVTLLATETATSDSVFFEDINKVVSQGSENVYVKVNARKMGLNEAGSQSTAGLTLAMDVSDAEGDESGKTVTDTAETSASNAFDVVPVRVSAVEFVSSFGGISTESTLKNGENNLAIIKVVTDSSTNLDSTDGSSLETLITEFNANQSRLTGADQTLITAYTIEKISGTEGEKTVTEVPGTNIDSITFTDTTDITVTAKSFGDTAITVTVADGQSGAEGTCDAATVSNGAAISVLCDLNADNAAQADHSDLEAALEATGLVDVTAATPASVLATTSQTLAGGSDSIVFTLSSLFSSDYKMTSGDTAYFVIRADITKDSTNDNDDYAKIEFNDLSSSAVEYKSDDSSTNNTLITDLRLSQSKASGIQINE